MYTFSPTPIRPMQDARRAIRVWLRLSPAQQAATPCPRVYANDARQVRAVHNIARTHSLLTPRGFPEVAQ